MNILVPGATGVLGRAVVPLLIEEGHRVCGVVRSEEARQWLIEAGADPLRVDLFDRGAVAAAMEGNEAVINFATALPPLFKMGRRRAWELNDRLRTEAVTNLVDASLEAGVSLFVQPSVTFNYADGGENWLYEDSPLDPPFAPTESALFAERETERFSSHGGRGVALRLSRLYGPGRPSADLVDMVRRGRGVVVGKGDNFTSNLHVNDAATAHVAALHIPAGIYNVTDDRPVAAYEWMSALASVLGAPRPRRIPKWLARPVLGGAANLLTVSQRVSNARFKETAGWVPAYPDPIKGLEDLA